MHLNRLMIRHQNIENTAPILMKHNEIEQQHNKYQVKMNDSNVYNDVNRETGTMLSGLKT